VTTGDQPSPVTPEPGAAGPDSDTRVLHLREFGSVSGAPAPAADAQRAPTRIGPYRILRQLGRGGMGTVFLAEPAASCPVPMGRLVALKILHRADPEERRRFEREAAYLQSLRHPGIVRVLDAGEHEGQPYLAMQLIEGKRLDDLVLKGPMPERQAADLVVQALEALHVAHLAGILHRDIKPGNIMLDRAGTVRILDFGLASQVDRESRLTRTGNVVGTPAYMSPEQASGQRDAVTRRSDVYSMGACLYELVTAFQPYTADNSVAVLRRIIDEPLAAPSQLRPGLSRDLETVILVSMAKDPRDRYPNAEAMAADLRRFLEGRTVRARRVSRLTLLSRSCWRHRRMIALGSLAGFLAVSSMILAVVHTMKMQARRAAEQLALEEQVKASEWTEVPTVRGAIERASMKLPVATLGKGVLVRPLTEDHPVMGPVRLRATVVFEAPEASVQLFIHDIDVGDGYGLRLDCAADGALMTLTRENRELKKRTLKLRHDHHEPWQIQIEYDNQCVSAWINEEPPLRCFELVPLDGPEYVNACVAFNPDAVVVRNLRLERRPAPANPLADADQARFSKRYTQAISAYRDFLKDNPDSPLARDARFRIALCRELAGNIAGNHEAALQDFLTLAQDAKSDPQYTLQATFHAWRLSLNDPRHYDLADQLFERVRHDYELDALLSYIDDDTRKDLVQKYIDRGNTMGSIDPKRAQRLFATAAELATFLRMAQEVGLSRTREADMLVALGKYDEAQAILNTTMIDQQSQTEWRLKAYLKAAEVCRLRDDAQNAASDYLAVMKNAIGKDDLSQWARLWLGDLSLEEKDREHALALWRESPESQSLPGAIMARLVAGTGPMPETTDAFFANDIEYFIGRLALLAGDAKAYREALKNVVHMGPAYDWPTPLAVHLLSKLGGDEDAVPTPSP
jgi:hypothetical protein